MLIVLFSYYQVLSNCQRHVKLCQKRSAKVLNPSEDDFGTDSPGAVTSFIQFPNDSSSPSQPAPGTETAARRGHEVPIRPKLVSRDSGSAGSIVSVVSAPGRRQNRAGSNSSVGSPVPKLETPSMPQTLERSGSGSAVPVVPSSSTYPSSYGYPPSNTYGTYRQGGYESGTTFNNAYVGYNASGPRYDQVSAGFKQNSGLPNFEAASAAAYDSLNPSFNAPSSGYEHSVPAYETTSPGYDRPESGFSQPQQPYAAATAGPPHNVQSLPSPSHVQPTSHSTASPTTVSHDTGSYFTNMPGMYAVPSARRPSVTSSVPSSRRSTITYTQVQRDALGFRDAGVTDTPSIGATSDAVAGGPIAASGPYYPSSSGLVAAPYEAQQLKQEEVVSEIDQHTWAKEQAYQTGYSESQWVPAAGTEAPSYHAYHTDSASSTDLAGPHESHVASTSTGYASYPQQQQPHRQQLYLHQAQGGYPNPSGQQQQGQQHDAYGDAAYASRSAAYGMNSGAAPVPRHAHQDSSSYAWSSSESVWNTQPGYRS
ncbi:unnamed protein product [Rhizoctonia solani]|uniref:Uncharacterized protein n=1 Tax=Rhizoctonia solani TaxID=456999 RepID=A0A8H3BUW7_9AGAM|nr:unnamed protein product [Rhizoctonia solani]